MSRTLHIFFCLVFLLVSLVLSACSIKLYLIDQPTVMTKPATNVDCISATLHGDITDIGDMKASTTEKYSIKRCFQYGLTTSYGSDICEEGLFGAGTFSLTISGLAANTKYHVRAYATNSLGTSYGKDQSFTTAFIESDYYYGFINSNGTLKFTNKDTGETIVDNTGEFYLNYGSTQNNNVTPVNPSIETATNGIPDGWKINQNYIRSSTNWASDCTHSLRFENTTTDTSDRVAKSPLIIIHKDADYSGTIDSYYDSLTNSTSAPTLYIFYYTTLDGSGTEYNTHSLTYLPAIVGKKQTTPFYWVPPPIAKSFIVAPYIVKSEISNFYIDNLKVYEIIKNYETNGCNITTTITNFSDNITVIFTDDSNYETTISNQYDLNVHSPSVTYTITLTYKQAVMVYEERVDFTVPTQMATIMTRDLVLNPYDSSKEYYSDLYTPKAVKFDNGLSFLGTDTMQSMRLRSNYNQSQLSFYSDYALNHPHFYYVKNAGGVKNNQDAQNWPSEYSYSSSVTFYISLNLTPKSLVKTRQPNGYDATLVITTHGDDELTSTVKTIAYGTEDTADPVYGTKGILGNHLSWTSSVFVTTALKGYDALSNPAYKALHDQMYQDGAEIITHSVNTITDNRSVVDTAMAYMQQNYASRNWIDHGATSGMINWEDLASQGTIKNDLNYVLDLFANYGYCYAWSYIDLPTISDFGPPTNALNILAPSITYNKTPFFYYNNNVDDNPGDDSKIYLWSTVCTRGNAELFYTNGHVDDLITQRGVSIGHSYLASAIAQNHSWYLNPSKCKTEIYPAFESELGYTAARKAAGLIWIPTMSQFGDYLVLLPNVSVVNNADGMYTITNHNSTPITGLTLLAEFPIHSVSLDGVPFSTFGGSYGANEIVLPKLAAGQSYVLAVTH